MKLSYFRTFPDAEPVTVDTEWAGLVELLTTFRDTDCAPCSGKHCRAKFGPSWSPTTFDGERSNDKAGEISALVYDLDDLPADYETGFRRLRGLQCVIHSTHSHTAENPRLRVCVALAEPIPAARWRAVWLAAAIDLELPADPACKDPARLYFLPSSPPDAPRVALIGEGEPYRPQQVTLPKSQPVRVVPKPLEDLPIEAVDAGQITKLLADLRYRKARAGQTEHAELLDAVIRGEPLAKTGNRSVRINQASSLIAYALPDNITSEVFAEILSPALYKTELDPEGFDHWISVAIDSFDRARHRKSESDRIRKEHDSDLRKRLQGLVPKPQTIGTDPEIDPFEDWEKLLLTSDKGAVLNNGENAFITLMFSPETRNTIRFDLVSKKIEIAGGPLADASEGVLEVEACDWLARYYGLSLKPHDVGLRLGRAAWANRFDPLSDYLNGLQWDGVDRLGVLLRQYARVTTSPSGADVSQIAQVCSRKWARSAVARALSPGCKVDTVLILEGEGGLGKSTFFDLLGGRWFCDERLDIGNKDSKQLAASYWILELAELESFRRAEDNARKQFFAQRVDKFRPPYAKAPQEFPRRAVFVGTTNDHQYLTDRTGNRRYWPFATTGDFDRAALARDRDQLWAQAVAEYRQWESLGGGENFYQWWLTSDEQKIMDVETEARLKEPHFDDRIYTWWVELDPIKRPQFVTASVVAQNALQFPIDRISQGVLSEIGVTLARMGFSRHRQYLAGKQIWGYKPSADLLTMPKRGRAQLWEVTEKERVAK